MKKSVLGWLVSPFAITQLIMAATVGTALWLAYAPWRFERLKDELRKPYPAIAHVDAYWLKEWMVETEGPKPVVIDVRTPAEYEFSHVPGARRMDLSDTPATLGIMEKSEIPFVICDTTGVDSFPVAASLAQRGYARVHVLEGGIFDWANKGMPLEGPGGPANKVKSGASRDASLLKRRLRAP